MLIAPASFTMGPHLSRNPLYNPVTDFAPINLVADVPFVMVVPPTLPVADRARSSSSSRRIRRTS